MSEDNFVVDKFKSLNPLSRWIAVGASVAGILILPAGLHYSGMLAQKPSASVTQESKTAIAKQEASKAVTALGRLEPLGEVIKISAPSTQGGKGTLAQLLVKEGDKVQRGQVIAVLDNRQRLEAAFVRAQEDVKVSQANLGKVKAGAKQGEINAQKGKLCLVDGTA